MRRYFFVLLITASFYKVNAQGCSDAGFCSLKYAAGDMGKNSITIGNAGGITDGHTFVNTGYLSYTRQLSRNLQWDTKFTAGYASGKLASNFNAGDIISSISAGVWQNNTKQKRYRLLAGVKIPLTAANDKAGGKPLPMAYQASLGTFDLLIGNSVQINKWEFTNAWQIPLSGENKNSFLKEYAFTNDFASTNKFKRKADVLLRAAYTAAKQGSKFSFKPNLLAVYHLGKDSYEDIYGKRQLIAGSDGLTLNANIIGKYTINRKQAIELSVAAPFVVRDIRPDGLTREFTAELAYKVSF